MSALGPRNHSLIDWMENPPGPRKRLGVVHPDRLTPEQRIFHNWKIKSHLAPSTTHGTIRTALSQREETILRASHPQFRNTPSRHRHISPRKA